MRSISTGQSARRSAKQQRVATRRLMMATIARALVMCAVVVTRAETASPRHRPEIPLGLDLYMPIPADNPLTEDKVALGRKLFADPRLSRDRSLSCASCHDPIRGFTDGRPVSVGVFGRQGTGNVPTLVNRAYGRSFFWDGRTESLEEQVLQPIQDSKEMDMTLDEAVERLSIVDTYVEKFQKVFGRAICAEDVAKALASYVRTILSGDAPIDQLRVRGDETAMPLAARRGLSLFRGKANCTACHIGPNLTDEDFHNTGIAWRDGQLRDAGRYLITERPRDRGAFKTPTLREIGRTAPFMHDGSISTLEKVIEHYNNGGIRNVYLDVEIRPLKLTSAEQRDLVAFLKSLTSD